MQAFYCDHFVLPLPGGHRFPMQKYAMLRNLLAQLPQIQLQEALPASEAALALVHTPGYIQAVTQGSLSAAEQRDIGFPWSPAMAERACRSVGATLQAAQAALAGGGIAANLAGGTHHAHADKGSGFCVFNDVAVTARQMQAQHQTLLALQQPQPGSAAQPAHRQRRLQVAVIDLDVHQGDGTAQVFADDNSVFTLSLHGAKNFPFQKQHSDCDIELPDGCTDAPYLAALAEGLQQLSKRFSPDLLLYLAGADPHEDDRLGRLSLTDAGMQARDSMVFDWAWQHRTPLAMVMAGGYGHDIQSTLRVQRNTFALALRHWQRWQHGRGQTKQL